MYVDFLFLTQSSFKTLGISQVKRRTKVSGCVKEVTAGKPQGGGGGRIRWPGEPQVMRGWQLSVPPLTWRLGWVQSPVGKDFINHPG